MSISEKKVYRVEVTAVGYVLASDYTEACKLANRYSEEIVSDNGAYPDVDFYPLKTIRQLEQGWGGNCLLYAADEGDFPIRDFLPETQG